MIGSGEQVWVKVCGVTRVADVSMIQDAGADAIGVNTLERSPRRVDEDAVVRIAEAAEIAVVVLVENEDPETIVVRLDVLGVDGVQPYGESAAEVAAAAAEAGWLALLPTRPGATVDIPGVTPLYDTPDPVLLGGTGRTFDWTTLAAEHGRFVIAGGLRPDNVAAAVRATGAWGVDASSGLEVEVGVKDVGKVNAFVREARRA